MHRVGLRGQDALGLLLRDPWRECLMRHRDVLRDIRNHIDALLDVLVEQVGPELGIENPASKKNERQNEQDGDKRDEQIRDNQAVAQAPEQPASPPADESHEKVDGGEDSQILQKTGRTRTEVEELEQQASNNHKGRKNIEPGDVVPDFFERSADGCHRAVSESNTLPEEVPPA